MTFCGSEKPIPLNLLQWFLALFPIGNKKKAGDQQENAEVLFPSPQSLTLKLKSGWTVRCSTSSAGLHYHPTTPKHPFLGYNISIREQMTCLSHPRKKSNRQAETIPESNHMAAQRLSGPDVAKVRTSSGITENIGVWGLVRRQGRSLPSQRQNLDALLSTILGNLFRNELHSCRFVFIEGSKTICFISVSSTPQLINLVLLISTM